MWPGLGARNLFRNQTISFPVCFYGIPRLCLAGRLCLSPALTDSQLAAGAGSTATRCRRVHFWEIDHLNTVVAPGHASIPAMRS